MNDVENALRDAFAARASGVAPDPSAYAAVVRRRSRRTRQRWTVVSAGVATALVVGAAAVAARDGAAPRPVPPASATPTPEATGAPREVVAISDGQAAFYDADDIPTGNIATSIVDHEVTALTDVGDGRWYYTAQTSNDDECHSELTAYGKTGPHEITANDVPGGDDVDGHVDDIAVTADRSRLAYAVRVDDPGGERCDVTELRVRDLKTGKERVWTGGPDVKVASLGWDPEGRRLVFTTTAPNVLDTGGFRVLDTEEPGTSFLDPEPVGGSPDGIVGLTCWLGAPAFRGRTGELTAARYCNESATSADPVILVVDPETGDSVRELFRVPSGASLYRVEWDASGEHALIEDGIPDVGGAVVQRWDGGPESRHVDLAKRQLRHLVW